MSEIACKQQFSWNKNCLQSCPISSKCHICEQSWKESFMRWWMSKDFFFFFSPKCYWHHFSSRQQQNVGSVFAPILLSTITGRKKKQNHLHKYKTSFSPFWWSSELHRAPLFELFCWEVFPSNNTWGGKDSGCEIKTITSKMLEFKKENSAQAGNCRVRWLISAAASRDSIFSHIVIVIWSIVDAKNKISIGPPPVDCTGVWRCVWVD